MYNRCLLSAVHSLQCAARLSIRNFGFAAVFALLLGTASAQNAATSLDGAWVNADPGTHGLSRIEIEENTVHPYGACHPTACDWGLLPARTFARSVNGGPPVALMVEVDNHFALAKIVVVLESSDRLRVEVLNHFTDGSTRADYFSLNYFVRERAPTQH